MAVAYRGTNFTFQILFLDALGNPTVVTNPSIEVFAFDVGGTKVTLVPSGTALSPVLGDTGRYSYIYFVPEVWVYQPTLYGMLTGVEPVTGGTIHAEHAVDVQSPQILTTRSGLIAQFVKGG